MHMKRVGLILLCVVLMMPFWLISVQALPGVSRGMYSNTTNGTAARLTGENTAVRGTTNMPDNPSVSLPTKIDSSIPGNATVISSKLAVTNAGVVKNLTTGATVNDPTIVGSAENQADPLAKTGGHKFIPVSVAQVRDSVSAYSKNAGDVEDSKLQLDFNSAKNRRPDAQQTSAASYSRGPSEAIFNQQQGGEYTARFASMNVAGNVYGTSWGSFDGQKAFFDQKGSLFAQQAQSVIDVSGWQKNIDWQAVKNSGVQGAIIRISYGWGNPIDGQAEQDINACKRLGIPFGLYVYSYAANGNDASAEAADTLQKLGQAGVRPGDLSYPIFYDLEAWVDDNRTPPTSVNAYDDIVNTWFNAMHNGGFTNLSVYSYTSYLYGPLNTSNIHSKTGWVASYGAPVNFNYPNNGRGWQYSDEGVVPGISGNVDLDVFGNLSYVDENPAGASPSTMSARLADIVEGDYYLVSAYPNMVADITGASTSNVAKAEIWEYLGGTNQIFHIKPLGDQKYMIIAGNSQKALDVFNAQSSNGSSVIQFNQTGAANQQWQIYRTPQGTVIFKSMTDGSKNRVLDITGGKSSNGTPLEIWGLNGGINQQFRIVPVGMYRPGAQGWTTVGGTTYWYDDGVRATSKEVLDPSSGWYYVDASGRRVSGWYTLPDGRYVYYDPSTLAMVHGERNIGGYWYYFDSTGNMAGNQDVFLASETKWVRYDVSGHMVYGENFHDGGWYYFDPITGAMDKGWEFLSENGGKWVYYNLNTGQMLHGEACINGYWYYFDDVTGATTYGWKELSGNRWVYYHPVDGRMLKGWHMVEGKMRYFDETTGAVTN